MRLFDMDSKEDYFLDGKYKVATPYAPCVDVVEVVRCKDCKHLRIDSDFVEGRYCSIRNVNGGGFCKDEDYCSYGKRRNGGEEE